MTAAQQRAFGRMKKNVLIIGVLVAVVVVAFVVMQVIGATTTARTVKVTDGAGNVYAMSLSDNVEQAITTDSGTNVVKVSGGKVCVVEADCPNQDCVNQGWISEVGQQIVCLPHKLIVEITDGDGASDGKAYDVVGS